MLPHRGGGSGSVRRLRDGDLGSLSKQSILRRRLLERNGVDVDDQARDLGVESPLGSERV
jgi:hypothetical protein